MNMPSGTMPEPGPFALAIAAEVRQAMARRQPQVTGAQLARLTGRSQSYMSKRLRGDSSFTANDIDDIARVLGEDLAALLLAAVRASRRT